MPKTPQIDKPLQLLETKDFRKQLNRLAKQGGKTDLIHRQVQGALYCWKKGLPPELTTTNHGESRIPHAVKYDLRGAYRLVVYEHAGKRIPLAVGSHADVDKWLERNRGCEFAVNPDTLEVDFTTADTDADVARGMLAGLEASPKARGPVLARLPAPSLDLLALPANTTDLINRFVTFEEVEDEQTAALLQGLSYPSDDTRELVLQVIALLAQDRLREAERAVEVYAGKAKTATADPAAFREAVDSGRNSDVLLDLSALSDADFKRLVSGDSLADWMLFLHPDQRALVNRVYNKPARLLGVSGSGKTSVLVHRANELAKRYPGERILILGLNAALVRLIRHLADALCGEPQRAQIEAMSIYDYCYRVVKSVTRNAKLIERIDEKSGETLASCWQDFMDKPHAAEVAGPVLDALERRSDNVDARAYLLDELIWIRSGFGREERDEYLNVERPGRGILLPHADGAAGEAKTNVGGFPADTRRRLLHLLADYEEYMEAGGLLDDDGVSQEAFALAPRIRDHPAVRARCVLVDEVQDCSTVELAVIREIPTAEQDGLFLCGDPVQKVFAKHSELVRAGIDIKGNATVLRRNYRNTRQILEAAFRIIVDFRDQSPVSAEDVLEPEYAYRDGSRPTLYECDSREQQRELVLSYLRYYGDEERSSTCICSASSASLTDFERALRERGIATHRLGNDADAAGLAAGVKLALLADVKGFEFRNVFAIDLQDGDVMPKGMAYEERWRVAFQLYVAMTRARDELVMSYVYNPSILLRSLDEFVNDERAATMLT